VGVSLSGLARIFGFSASQNKAINLLRQNPAIIGGNSQFPMIRKNGGKIF